ncbi:hypothetical protein [Nonomuraea diastatica]|uniref:Uncharacterized protein n=1 Tax=Nonomuraea diastatica TaxID=1848329 RepID=A0A4R4W2U5_9ACTN|nr:hypothetical protein [Nonomuraea diastatica]TDD07270.1 hypothetical protein E1294_48365 [Nonomuraea diastatica]
MPGVQEDVARMTAALEEARESSALPERTSAGEALRDMAVRTRLRGTSPAVTEPRARPTGRA